jgi:Protein of unknown function (DUF2752)
VKLTSFITESRNSFYWPRLLAFGLLAGTLLLPFLAFDWVTAPGSLVLCPLRAVTGVPCPSCGLTRALAHLERGHLAEAVRLHPFAPLLFLLVLALAAMLAFELVARRTVIGNPLRNRRDVWLLFAGLLIFQVVRTVVFFWDGGWTVFRRENLVARLLALAQAIF